ncbi:MAG: hypothetical protein ACLFRA_01880 [Alphaproteobacteria bacterium]
MSAFLLYLTDYVVLTGTLARVLLFECKGCGLIRGVLTKEGSAMCNFTRSILYSTMVLAAGLVAIFSIYNSVSVSPDGSAVSQISPAAGDSTLGVSYSESSETLEHSTPETGDTNLRGVVDDINSAIDSQPAEDIELDDVKEKSAIESDQHGSYEVAVRDWDDVKDFYDHKRIGKFEDRPIHDEQETGANTGTPDVNPPIPFDDMTPEEQDQYIESTMGQNPDAYSDSVLNEALDGQTLDEYTDQQTQAAMDAMGEELEDDPAPENTAEYQEAEANFDKALTENRGSDEVKAEGAANLSEHSVQQDLSDSANSDPAYNVPADSHTVTETVTYEDPDSPTGYRTETITTTQSTGQTCEETGDPDNPLDCRPTTIRDDFTEESGQRIYEEWVDDGRTRTTSRPATIEDIINREAEGSIERNY